MGAQQTLIYLRLANLRLGLLLDFGAALMKDGIARLVNGLPDDLPQFLLASSRLGASFHPSTKGTPVIVTAESFTPALDHTPST